MGWSPRRTRVVLAALVVAFSGSALVAVTTRSEEQTRPEDRAGDAEFAGALKLSLSPLASQAVALRNALRDLTVAATPPPATVPENFRGWSDEFGTARDLVSRLIPPPGRTVARDGAMLGAMFYREAALTVTGVTSADDVGAWRRAAQRGLRLRVIGDRLFDASRRMLNPARSGALKVAGLPDPVPDFRQNGPDPQRETPPPVPDKVWLQHHSGELRRAAAAVSAVTRGDPAVVRSTLETLSDELRGPLPARAERAEGVVLVRLSLLAATEALESADQQGLRLLAGQLLKLGHGLLPAASMAA